MIITQWRRRDFARRDLVTTALRAIVSATMLLLVYYFAPVESRPHESVILRLTVGLALFVAVLTVEIREISKNEHPMLRAGTAMATVIPLFLVVFAWTYLTLAHSDPATFASPLTRTGSLYFTVTVFSTVGFGDITRNRGRPVGHHCPDAGRPGRARCRRPSDPRRRHPRGCPAGHSRPVAGMAQGARPEFADPTGSQAGSGDEADRLSGPEDEVKATPGTSSSTGFQ